MQFFLRHTFPIEKKYLGKALGITSSSKQGKSVSDDGVHSNWAFFGWVVFADLGGDELHGRVYRIRFQQLVNCRLKLICIGN